MDKVPSLEYISVSKDAYDSLKHMLFGAWSSIYIASSERAYRDMCRTLRNIRQSDTNSTKLRAEIDLLSLALRGFPHISLRHRPFRNRLHMAIILPHGILRRAMISTMLL